MGGMGAGLWVTEGALSCGAVIVVDGWVSEWGSSSVWRAELGSNIHEVVRVRGGEASLMHSGGGGLARCIDGGGHLVGVGKGKFLAIDAATATVEHFADFGTGCFNVACFQRAIVVHVFNIAEVADVLMVDSEVVKGLCHGGEHHVHGERYVLDKHVITIDFPVSVVYACFENASDGIRDGVISFLDGYSCAKGAGGDLAIRVGCVRIRW